MNSPNKIEGGSLLDGINIPVKAAQTAKPSIFAKMQSGPQISMNPKDWNQKQRKIAAIAGCCLCLAMLAGAAWLAMWMQPPALPTTADEAIKVMASSKFENLDEQRKAEYREAAATLFAQLPWEERRKMFQDEKTRDEMRAAFEQQMESGLRKWAKGDQDSPFSGMPWGGPGGGGPGGPRPDGERRPRDPNNPDQPGGPNGGPGGGGPNGGPNGGGQGGGNGRGPAGDPNARRDGAERRMAERVGKGNPQANGLGAQARQAMQKSRQGGGGR